MHVYATASDGGIRGAQGVCWHPPSKVSDRLRLSPPKFVLMKAISNQHTKYCMYNATLEQY